MIVQIEAEPDEIAALSQASTIELRVAGSKIVLHKHSESGGDFLFARTPVVAGSVVPPAREDVPALKAGIQTLHEGHVSALEREYGEDKED